MRIAFLTTEFVTESAFAGGLGNYLFRTALALKQQYNFSPVVFVRADSDEHLVHEGIDVFRVKPRAPLWVKALDALTLRRLSGAWAQISASTSLWERVLAEHDKAPFAMVQAASYEAVNLCAPTRIPSVVRLSSFEPLWRKAYNKKLTLRQRLAEYFEIRAIQAADGVYAPSRKIAGAVESTIRRPVAAIQPAFVNDTGPLDYSVYNKNLKGRKYLLFFGTIGPLKGCEEIALVLHELLEKNPDLYFVFIGSTANEYSKKTKQHLQDASGDFLNRVLFFTPLKHETLYSIITESVAVVLPSRIDNFPNTCVEAMYLGQTVVGTNGTSFEELIDNGLSGFLCNPGDPASLMAVLIRVLGLTPEQRATVSANARKRIEMLLPQTALPGLVRYYEKVVETRIKTGKQSGYTA